MKAIERLEQLREAGVAMSRNQNFALFAEPEFKQALSLHRYLDAIAEEIREGRERGSLQIAMNRGEDGRVALTIARTDLSTSHTAHLEPREVRALAELEGVEEALHVSGIHWADDASEA